ncbi:MAG: 3'-5' exonuclease [Magnetococcales bacterium]|nr:3'-5' exonuclease [Magnetococcales bacterium]
MNWPAVGRWWQRWSGQNTSIKMPLGSQRMVVVDVETSGPDPKRDNLIAIGAMVIQQLSIRYSDTLDVVVQQEVASSRENILFHGIGAEAQLQGLPPKEALQLLLELIGHDPLVAFHAPFDQLVLTRALREHLHTRIDNPWLDLFSIAPVLYPHRTGRLQSLDDWSLFFGIHNSACHNALADVFTTAQLGLILFKAAMKQGNRNFADLLVLGQSQRWLSVRG